MTKQEFIHKIPTLRQVSTVFSQATRMPMVFCHEKTMDDYIFVYLDDQKALEKAKALTAGKNPAFVVSCKEKEILPFFAELRLIGINAICFVVKEELFYVELKDIVRFPKFEEMPAERRPLENPNLHLSMLYFMQEVRRPVAMEEKKNLRVLEEETSANLAKSKFILAIKAPAEGDEQDKAAILSLKNDKDEQFIPIFTDVAELRRFLRGADCKIVVAEFEKIANMVLMGGTSGIAINPSTSNVTLSREGIASVQKRFLQ